MIQITSREFRSNQASFFAKADAGETVVIHRRGKRSYMLTPVSDDDFTITPQLRERIANARLEHNAGNIFKVENQEDLSSWLDSL